MSRIFGTALKRAGINEVDDRASGVHDVFDDERRRAQARMLRRFAVGWMDEHHRAAPVELVENRIEARIAKIMVVYAGKKSDPVEAQNIERIGYFL